MGRSHTAKRWGRLHLRRASDSREKMLWWDQHQGVRGWLLCTWVRVHLPDAFVPWGGGEDKQAVKEGLT